MLFHSSLRRELARSFGATLVVLFTIVLTMLLIRTLGLASKGSVNPEEIMLVLGYTVLGRMPTVLTLALAVPDPTERTRLHVVTGQVRVVFNVASGDLFRMGLQFLQLSDDGRLAIRRWVNLLS